MLCYLLDKEDEEVSLILYQNIGKISSIIIRCLEAASMDTYAEMHVFSWNKVFLWKSNVDKLSGAWCGLQRFKCIEIFCMTLYP